MRLADADETLGVYAPYPHDIPSASGDGNPRFAYVGYKDLV
jgi:hypothetical protein